MDVSVNDRYPNCNLVAVLVMAVASYDRFEQPLVRVRRRLAGGVRPVSDQVVKSSDVAQMPKIES